MGLLLYRVQQFVASLPDPVAVLALVLLTCFLSVVTSMALAWRDEVLKKRRRKRRAAQTAKERRARQLAYERAGGTGKAPEPPPEDEDRPGALRATDAGLALSYLANMAWVAAAAFFALEVKLDVLVPYALSILAVVATVGVNWSCHAAVDTEEFQRREEGTAATLWRRTFLHAFAAAALAVTFMYASHVSRPSRLADALEQAEVAAMAAEITGADAAGAVPQEVPEWSKAAAGVPVIGGLLGFKIDAESNEHAITTGTGGALGVGTLAGMASKLASGAASPGGGSSGGLAGLAGELAGAGGAGGAGAAGGLAGLADKLGSSGGLAGLAGKLGSSGGLAGLAGKLGSGSGLAGLAGKLGSSGGLAGLAGKLGSSGGLAGLAGKLAGAAGGSKAPA